MLGPPSKLEMLLALEQRDRLIANFSSRCKSSALLASAFVPLALIALLFSQPMLAFNSIVIALIFVVRAIDAHGMVQEARRRSDKILVVRAASSPSTKQATEPGLSH